MQLLLSFLPPLSLPWSPFLPPLFLLHCVRNVGATSQDRAAVLQPQDGRHAPHVAEEEGPSSAPEAAASPLNCPALAGSSQTEALLSGGGSTPRIRCLLYAAKCHLILRVNGTYMLMQHLICKFLSPKSVSKWFIMFG